MPFLMSILPIHPDLGPAPSGHGAELPPSGCVLEKELIKEESRESGRNTEKAKRENGGRRVPGLVDRRHNTCSPAEMAKKEKAFRG